MSPVSLAEFFRPSQNASSVHDENLVKIDGDWNGGARSTTWTEYYLHFNKMWNLAASKPVP